MVGKAGRLLGRAASEYLDDGCPQRAAAISYYALFSLFPLAILAVAVMGLIVDDQQARDRVISTVLAQLPLREDEGRAEIESLLRETTQRGATFSVVGAFGLLFAASGVMGAIRHALNAAFDVTDPRPPLRGKAVDFLFVLGFGALVGLSFAATVAFQVTDQFAELLGGVGSAAEWLVQQAGRLVPALLAMATFTVLFIVAPKRRLRLRDVWPGILIATAGYELLKWGFAIYLANFADYGTVYASLSTAIAFSVFIFLAANIVLLAAEAAAEWPGVRDEEPAEKDEAEPQPPLRQRLAGALKGLVVERDREQAERRDRALDKN